MDHAYTVNLTRRELVVHPYYVLAAPLVHFTLLHGWDWTSERITTWDPRRTGNFVLHLVDTETDTLLPEYTDYLHLFYHEQDAFEAHRTRFLTEEAQLFLSS